ncbi:MAG: PKD domain-containing protein, partial [Gammaproteobacteria bacterium]|nr:PKD domain-containing protein [Gammaproteobacteria bacterium]
MALLKIGRAGSLSTVSRLPTLNGVVLQGALLLTLALAVPVVQAEEPNVWCPYESSDGSLPTPRHEAGGLAIGKDFYLLGGRQMRPVERLNTKTKKWANLGTTPMEMHHFQPIEWGGKIYVIGAFTCCYPDEPSISHIQIFDPVTKTWSIGDEIPASRLRGSTGAVVYNDKIYILGGNTLGHNGGAVNWFDEYDPATGEWTVMPNAPHARDHFVAVLVGDKLVAAAGRQSALPVPQANTESGVDVFDFKSGKWLNGYQDIPTPRAGGGAVNYKREVLVLGGETVDKDAEAAVEALNVDTKTWRSLPSMSIGRHGQGAAVIDDHLYVAAGSTVRGGSGETDSVEWLDLRDPGADD